MSKAYTFLVCLLMAFSVKAAEAKFTVTEADRSIRAVLTRWAAAEGKELKWAVKGASDSTFVNGADVGRRVGNSDDLRSAFDSLRAHAKPNADNVLDAQTIKVCAYPKMLKVIELDANCD